MNRLIVSGILVLGALWILGMPAKVVFADSYTYPAPLNTNVLNHQLASAPTLLVPANYQTVKLDWIWVNCGVNNNGSPLATVRMYLDLSSDSVEMYFVFVNINPGWNGVLSGKADYHALTYSAIIDPTWGTSNTGVSILFSNNLITPVGGTFNSVVRIWVDGVNAQVYVSACQYGIGYTGTGASQQQVVFTSTTTTTTTNIVSNFVAVPITQVLTSFATSTQVTPTTQTNIIAQTNTVTTTSSITSYQSSLQTITTTTGVASTTATLTTTSPTRLTATQTSTEVTRSTSEVLVLANPPVEFGIALLAAASAASVLIPRIRARQVKPSVCRSCGFVNPPYAKSFCVKCGESFSKD